MSPSRVENTAPYEILDPGDGNAIIVDRWNNHIPMVIAASTAETGTLQDPVAAGQRVALIAKDVGAAGARAITADSPVNAGGDTVLTFNADYDFILLESFPVAVGGYEWRIIVNESVALS
jgi:hypothetical protein